MFEEIDGVDSRQMQNLRPYDPTDGQAEVLVFGVIEPTLICGVAYRDGVTRDTHRAITGDRQTIVSGANAGYFAARSYVRVRR